MYTRDTSPTTKWTKQDTLNVLSSNEEDEEEDGASDVFSVNCVGCTKLDAGKQIIRKYQILRAVSGYYKKNSYRS